MSTPVTPPLPMITADVHTHYLTTVQHKESPAT
jgi:hypothetical protein